MANIKKSILLDMCYNMILTREIETRIEKKLYRQGKIIGGVYVGRGQEAVTCGVISHCNKEDWVCPSHRDMGAFIHQKVPLNRILAQYMGREEGLTRGRDGNMHMGSLEHHLIAFVSMLGDSIPVAAGIGMSLKMQKKNNVVFCFFGDGSTSRGDWHEGLNFAAVKKVPVVYVCNNNTYAYSTPNNLQYPIEHVVERGDGYGIPWEVVDGNDIIAVHEATTRAVKRARTGGGPSLIECKTFRMTGHSAHDDAGYVPPKLFDEWKRKDPIHRFKKYLQSQHIISEKDFSALEKKAVLAIDRAVDEAEAFAYPQPERCLEDVYGSTEANNQVVSGIPWWRS